MDFTISDKLTAHLLTLSGDIRAAAAQALNEVAEETMTDAKELTPVDTGRLRSSGHVNQYATADDMTAKLVFGTEYAAAVHEIPPPPAKSPGGRSARHTVGQWKYLETPVKAHGSRLAADVAQKMGEILGGS